MDGPERIHAHGEIPVFRTTECTSVYWYLLELRFARPHEVDLTKSSSFDHVQVFVILFSVILTSCNVALRNFHTNGQLMHFRRLTLLLTTAVLSCTILSSTPKHFFLEVVRTEKQTRCKKVSFVGRSVQYRYSSIWYELYGDDEGDVSLH